MSSIVTQCDIELGESTGARKLGLERWWWIIHTATCTINSENFCYRTKASASRAARSHANRFRLAIMSTYEYGKAL